MAESLQQWIARNRPPRVHITYDVETAGATEKRELPLVMGILADLSGDTVPAKTLREREFVQIDRDNFNDVMKAIQPSLKIKEAELTFQNIDDFTPDEIVKKVAALKQLLEQRQQLRDLITKLDGNEKLETQLWELVS